MMLVKQWFALSNKCRYHHHKQILTHPMTFIAKILFLMQWFTINCTDFANIKFHSSNPWLRNVYVIPLSKRINALENTCLKNQNKSSCIYKYVPIHLCAWNKMMSLRNANQYRSFCIFLFSFYLLYGKWKNLFKQ